ncbi:MAG: hypothetical protein JWL86_448 [Rhizobium sp.]|nr:hypothetical protein [Rhizobium sp.]
MAFIDNQMTVFANHVIDLAIAHQALYQRDVDNACRLSFPAPDNADLFWINVQK